LFRKQRRVLAVRDRLEGLRGALSLESQSILQECRAELADVATITHVEAANLDVQPSTIELNGVLYPISIHRIQDPITGSVPFSPRNLQLYLCGGCNGVIQPLPRKYCDDRCKNEYWNQRAKLNHPGL